MYNLVGWLKTVLCRRSAVRSTRSPQYARRSTRRRTPRSAGTAVEYFVVFTVLVLMFLDLIINYSEAEPT